MRTVVAGVLVLTVAACTESSVSPAAGPSASETSGAASNPPTTPITQNTPVVNGRITSVQRHLRRDVGSYHWLAFDSASDIGLHVSYRFCRDCRPRGIDLARFTVVGPDGRVTRLTCADGPLCRASDDGTAATLGPAADEVTVESGDRSLHVIGYDGALRRTIDLTGSLARRDDIGGLAWSPDGDHLAVLTHRARRRSDFWLVEGDEPAALAYTSDNPHVGRAAWSPDGRSLAFEALLPSRRRKGWIRSVGSDIVVLHRSPAGRSPAMTPQTRYRSDRHFDWAGNFAWSPDGTRIAVRTSGSIAEISAEDGSVLARHPQNRRTSGWLIWLRREQ
jgi:WD40 repeat protein